MRIHPLMPKQLFAAAGVNNDGMIERNECTTLVASIYALLDPSGSSKMSSEDESVCACVCVYVYVLLCVRYELRGPIDVRE